MFRLAVSPKSVALAFSLSGACSIAAWSQEILIDDFDDLDHDGWTHNDLAANRPWGPTLYDASEGFCRIRTSGNVPVNTGFWVGATWEGLNPLPDGLVRARLRIDSPGSGAGLHLRSSVNPLLGYSFALNAGCRCFAIESLVTGAVVFGTGAPPVETGVWWMLEAGTVGRVLSMKVWPADAAEPARPQIVVEGSYVEDGALHIGGGGAQHDGNTPLDISFDDIYFRPAASFRRGDTNDDRLVDISDAVAVLFFLFLGDGTITCQDAWDSNDDGQVDVSDPINTLAVLFLGQGSIPLPGTKDCGGDPTPDGLDCGEVENCP